MLGGAGVGTGSSKNPGLRTSLGFVGLPKGRGEGFFLKAVFSSFVDVFLP